VGASEKKGMRIGLSLVLFVTLGCGGSNESTRRRPLSDEDIAAFGAERAAVEEEEAPTTEPSSTIQLAGGERLQELRALIRFDAGTGGDPTCALYALRVEPEGVEEGRATISCETADHDAEVSLAPVDETRLPRLIAALTGARIDPAGSIATAPPREIHLWLETDRRRIDGRAAPIRWPAPGAEATEAPAERSPENLSEVWEAVMYPHRYR
jgi:hypothetical protein